MSEPTSTAATRANENDGVQTADVRDAAVKHAPKHTRLIRSARDGRVLSALMLPFFMARPPSGFGVITTTGRKTGKARRKCIRVIRTGNKLAASGVFHPELVTTRVVHWATPRTCCSSAAGRSS